MSKDEKTLNELRQDLFKEVDELKDSIFKLIDLSNMLMKKNEELTRQNHDLSVHVEELKIDNKYLMKIIMKSPESMAFPEMAHYIYFALIVVLKDNSLSDEEKLENLKTYLKPSLDEDVHEVLKYIEEFKQDNESHETLLNDLSSWIRYTYKLN